MSTLTRLPRRPQQAEPTTTTTTTRKRGPRRRGSTVRRAPPPASVGMARDAHPMRLACSPFARIDPSRAARLPRPECERECESVSECVCACVCVSVCACVPVCAYRKHWMTDDSTTAPEMTIGAPTRFGMRGSLPHCMTNPRLPNPFMADPRRPLPLRRRRRRRRCPETPLPGRITLPRPPFRCGPRPFSRPRPRDARDDDAEAHLTRCCGPRPHGPPCCTQRQWCARNSRPRAKRCVVTGGARVG